MPEKIKIYIDTSVWNFALETRGEESLLVHKFLNDFGTKDNYKFFISDLVYGEVNEAHEARMRDLKNLLMYYKAENLEITEEVFILSDKYLSNNVIPRNSFGDAVHIAVATVSGCEFLVSCNYKHMVSAKIIRGVHLINQKEGHDLIEIVSPKEFVGG
ncbi:MAG: PIN domain-containing protein [Candidatus Melainabacteria bacterium]|nr:PIN domain-containing protein [Candidatus Melainabacteria bacterium]